MGPWKTEAHFAPWLGLCPDNRISGDKVLARGTRHVLNRAAKALRLGASTLLKSQTYLGAQYRRLRMIRKRPAEAEDRAIPGYWEGDLLSGGKNSYIATLVERHLRFLMLIKVPSKETEAVVAALNQRPRKTLGFETPASKLQASVASTT